MELKDKLRKAADEALEEVIALRKHFHAHPELSFEEFWTTKEIEDILHRMGIESHRLSPTGLYAYIGQGKKTLALRADIDGLMVTEDTGLSYASAEPGKMHACGHDGHIAALLGAARVLKQVEEDLELRVKLIFQPSEENTKGAKCIIEQGVLDDVDGIFGLHLFSDLDTGVISVEAGPRMAQTDRFRVIFHGKGGHAAKPHQCIDATVMASEFVMNAQTIIARGVDPVKGAVLTIGSMHSGTQYNIISEKAVLEGTCRSFEVPVAEYLREQITSRAALIAESYGGQAEVDYDFGSHPPVINDPRLAERISDCACQLLEKDSLSEVPAFLLGEDFSWYQTKVPGVFAFVGCKKQGRKVCYPNHHPKFDIDDAALKDALYLHIAAVLCFTDHTV